MVRTGLKMSEKAGNVQSKTFERPSKCLEKYGFKRFTSVCAWKQNIKK